LEEHQEDHLNNIHKAYKRYAQSIEVGARLGYLVFQYLKQKRFKEKEETPYIPSFIPTYQADGSS
jgi:hypothetical protein